MEVEQDITQEQGYIYNTQVRSGINFSYQNFNGLWTLTVADGDQITMGSSFTAGGNISNPTNTFWGIKLA